MREDPDNHGGLFDRGDNLEVAATLRAVFEVDIEHALGTVARGRECAGPNLGRAALFATDSRSFQAHHTLKEEVFGATSLVVRCERAEAMREVVEQMEGQLTITLQMDEGDIEAARSLMPTLERKAGRVLVNGFATSVEVAHAMVHGGPFPSTSDSRSTSVGTLSIRRFLHPVCYQDFPTALLPSDLRGDSAPVPRRIDGRLIVD